MINKRLAITDRRILLIIKNLMDKHNIISKDQYGFLSNKSQFDVICDVTEFVSNEPDKGNKSLEIFLDLAKAFDAVDHKL